MSRAAALQKTTGSHAGSLAASLRPAPANARSLDRTRKESLRCHCKRDPLELEIWKSWQDAEDDWATENFAEDELVDILFDGDGSAETAAQNILAVALSLLLAVAAGSILWRLAVVSFALISAAVRYSVVAVIFLFWFLITF